MSANAMARHKPQLLLWPESVLPQEWIWGPGAEPTTRALLSAFDATLITGVFIGDYNSMIGIDPERGFLGRYDKMRLVPFGEYVPYRSAFSKIPALGRWLNEEIFPIDVKPGKKYHIFNTRHGRVGGMICFESMLPGIARGLTRHGAEFIVVATNDAWFKRSPAAAQHVALAKLRAIENRRWLAQTANSGLSVIIDPRGRITAQSALMAKSTVNSVIYRSRNLSFYTRFGDVFAIFCVISLLPLFAAALLLGNESKP
jgi:apolipoprotein N-acyltransferase